MKVADILKPGTKADFFRMLLSLAQVAGFPVKAWQERNVARKTFEVLADILSKFSISIAEFCKSAFVSEATGDWLTILAKDIFGIDRLGATRAFRDVTIANYTGSTVTASAYSVVLKVAGKEIYFTNTSAISIPDGSGLTYSFQSTAQGASQNSVNLGLEVISGLPTSLLISSTISASATDQERDEDLRVRCLDQWAMLANGTDEWYAASARRFNSTIKKVSVSRSTPSAGKVTVYIANESGLSATGTDALLENYWDPKPAHNGVAGWADDTYVQDGDPVVVAITGTLTLRAEDIDAARDTIANELLVYQRELPMGASAKRNEIVEVIQASFPRHPKNKLVLTLPAADEISVALNEFIVFDTTSLAFEVA